MIRRTAALLSLIALQAPVAPLGAADPIVPTPMGQAASASAQVAQPANPPFVVPKPTGKLELPAGKTKVQIEDKVSKLHPTAYTYLSPGGQQFFWIGVSSPKTDVFLTVFDYKTRQPISGTLPSDKAIRTMLAFKEPTELLVVAHTESEGTPFRFEVNLGGIQL